MGDLHGARIAVVGGGILGLSIALSLATRGGKVVVYESESLGDGASWVAAGMLAPAFEAALDPLSAGHFPLLRAARDRWPAFVASLDLPPQTIDRSGAIWAALPGEGDTLRGLFKRLGGEGASAELLTAHRVISAQPGLSQDVIGGVFAANDWRIDPLSLLPSLDAALQRAGVTIVRALVSFISDEFYAMGKRIEADAVVLAAGAGGGALIQLAPELSVLCPVKGQILHLDAPPINGPVVRGSFGYVAPQARGAVVGATMQPGLNDRRVDPDISAHLLAGAAALFPQLATAPTRAMAGVRASTPDGLPLIGPSSRKGLLLALGGRRNGWLLGPMVGEMIAADLLGEDAGPFALAMDPLRTFA